MRALHVRCLFVRWCLLASMLGLPSCLARRWLAVLGSFVRLGCEERNKFTANEEATTTFQSLKTRVGTSSALQQRPATHRRAIHMHTRACTHMHIHAHKQISSNTLSLCLITTGLVGCMSAGTTCGPLTIQPRTKQQKQIQQDAQQRQCFHKEWFNDQ